jgi:hypothetical protein
MTGHQVRSYGAVVSSDHRTPASDPGPPSADHHQVPSYEILIAGRLSSRWSAWFEGLTVAPTDHGTTVLRGPVVDQAALHGLLQKLRDAGIPLISLTPIASDQTPGPRVRTPHQEN